MNCSKCGAEVADEDIRVLKKGEYQNKPLCEDCFKKEKEW